MLLTVCLHLGWQAKCCSVAWKHLKIMQITAACCILHAICHEILFKEATKITTGAIYLYSLWRKLGSFRLSEIDHCNLKLKCISLIPKTGLSNLPPPLPIVPGDKQTGLFLLLQV
jgi:hypothetical protein